MNNNKELKEFTYEDIANAPPEMKYKLRELYRDFSKRRFDNVRREIKNNCSKIFMFKMRRFGVKDYILSRTIKIDSDLELEYKILRTKSKEFGILEGYTEIFRLY